MTIVFSVKLPYRVRCNLPECGKPVNLVFKEELEGIMNTFCSPQHAKLGENRWMEKKNKHIAPGVPPPLNDTEEYVSGNTDTLGGDDYE